MPRRGENVYKRKDGRWEGRFICAYRADGSAVYKSIYGRSYNEVHEKMVCCKSELAKKKTGSCALTIKEISIQWLAQNRFSVRKSTHVRYSLIVEKHIIPKLGAIRVDRLTVNHLSDFVTAEMTSGRVDGKGGLSPKTVRDITTILRSILKQIQRRYNLPDIANDIKPPKVPKHRVNILSAENLSRLDQTLKAKPSNYNIGILIGEYTGARLGELCALRWGDIDFHTQLIHIHATVQRLPTPKGTGQKTGLVITDPKTAGSDRFIPIPLQIVPILKEASKGKDRDAFIMTGRADKCLDPRTCQYRWKQLLTRLNIEYVNFHVLRHTFATTAIKKGMDVKNLSEILGHAGVKITLERYVHPTMDMKREQMNQLDFSVA